MKKIKFLKNNFISLNGVLYTPYMVGDLPQSFGFIFNEEKEQDNPGMVKTLRVAPPAGQGRVRLVRIGEIDLQPCGGTHVARTGEIGRVSLGRI